MTAATMAAAVEAASVEATSVPVAVEVVIVKYAMEPAISKAEAYITVVRPIITPVRIVPSGIVVVRYGHDAVCCWRRVDTGSVRSARGGRSVSRGSGRRHGRARWTFFRSGGVRRWWGAGSGHRLARHRVVAE